jgi:predicted nucleic acid-binding protein
MNMVRKKRNVTLDSSVLVGWLLSKKDDSIVRKVVIKSVNEDKLMLTDVIYAECMKHAYGRKARISKEDIAAKLQGLCPEIIKITPIPPEEDLEKKYKVRDKTDLKILYSVDITDSVILVTYDKDFFGDVWGVKAEIMRPENYLHEK